MLSDAVHSATGAAKSKTWVAGINRNTGEIAVTCSGLGNCAEPNILIGTGWTYDEVLFTRALKLQDFKDVVGKAWQDKEVCPVCQGMFPRDTFVPGVIFKLLE